MGFPQGYKLEQLLFLDFVNEIVEASSLLKFKLFPDWPSVYLSDESACNLYSLVNVELDKFRNGILGNRLALNFEKIMDFFFSNKRQYPIKISYLCSLVSLEKNLNKNPWHPY